MSDPMMEPADLRARGFAVLVDALGWANAVRFIQEYEPSRFNYTQERDQLLPNWDAAELVRQMKVVKSLRCLGNR